MEYIVFVSRIIHSIINKIIGHKKIVSIRRDIFDINCRVFNSGISGAKIMNTGSRLEGFEMKSSDLDVMVWMTSIHVICEISQAQLYNSQTNEIILMEYEHSLPGYVLLRPLGPNTHPLLKNSLKYWQNHLYFSSEMCKCNNSWPMDGVNTHIHGPCTNSSIGFFELDMAICLNCRHWPKPANPWITRCENYNWPDSALLQSIVESGCHCVAIGAKQSPQESLEWRISFASAERKLIRSMTHEQFLCYGLLKIILNEVLNYNLKDDEKLLCSYFMKTAVFWTIQTNSSLLWTADNFFPCFWACYKLLMKWVYHGYCPNFIIPENNMFLNKIFGNSQEKLFSQMYELYCEGNKFLLKCKSIHRHEWLHFNDVWFISSVDDIDIDFGLSSLPVALPLSLYSSKLLFDLFVLNKCKLSQVQHLVVFKNIIHQLHNYAFMWLSPNVSTNREMYKNPFNGLKTMKSTSKNGCVSDILYLCIYLYKSGNYRQALNMLDEAKSRLARPYIMYRGVNRQAYRQAMSGQPMLTKYKQAWAQDIILSANVLFGEFKLECLALGNCSKTDIHVVVSPNALVYFLSVLCYHQLHNTDGEKRSLTDLSSLVRQNDIPAMTKDIAFLMLGISQQLCGYNSDALNSFRTSLAQTQYNFITEVTNQRIRSLLWLE